MNRQLSRLIVVMFFFTGWQGWLVHPGFCAAGQAGGGPQAGVTLDWSAWREMPVFHDGRIMPVNTFARMTVEEICGRANPTLAPGDNLPEQARALFPGGKPRRFAACELLFGWLAAPEQWEHVPFLLAAYEPLRTEVLELPVHDAGGVRFKYVSPAELESNSRFWSFLRQMARDQRSAIGEKKKRTAVEQKAADLYTAYSLYRQLSYHPQSAGAARSVFFDKLAEFGHAWREFSDSWQRLQPLLLSIPSVAQQAQDGAAWERLDAAVRNLGNLARQDNAQLAALDEAASAVHTAAQAVARELDGVKDRVLAESPPGNWTPDQWGQVRVRLRALAHRAEQLSFDAAAIHLALYDQGYALRLVPALDPEALEKNRSPEVQRHPWLAAQCLLFGSEALLAEYPQTPIHQVREAFQQAVMAYRSDDPAKTEEFASATRQLAGAVRTLAEGIEPLRQQLPIRQRDEELIRITAYPPAGYTSAEVHYYQFDPFCWSWVLSALAMAALALALGVVRRPMYWLGTLLLTAALGLIAYGFGLRVYITGWAPVTNMFESIVFVAFVVGLMGLWLALYPLFGPGLQEAWQKTALPSLVARASKSGAEQPAGFQNTWNVQSALLSALRALLAAVVFVLLTLVPYGIGEGYTAIALWPRTDVGSWLPSLNDVVVWAVGIGVLVLAMWWIPRAVLAGAVAMVTVPAIWRRTGLAEPLRQTMARKPFALAGAAVTLLTALVAYYAPVSGKHLSPLMPVLRDNFWLTIHVLTITASYGAGALAWGLANIALGYYLLGRYEPAAATGRRSSALAQSTQAQAAASASEPREPRDSAGREKTVLQQMRAAAVFLPPRDQFAPHRAEPAPCTTLARFTYQATQAAVLLLAAGTIFGALWADVAWGRFWGWDSKEVWALISLLVYLAILHARYVGWVGNFGLAVGSLAGATSILMAWYGVNFVLGSGLHSYGEGAGGFGYVIGTLAANWLLAAVAVLRYRVEAMKIPVAAC